MNKAAPIDVLESLQRKLSGELEEYKKRGYDLQLLINAKPKGQMRKLNSEMKELMMERSRIEGNLDEITKDLEKAKAKAAKKAK